MSNAEKLGFDPKRLARVGARIEADIAANRYDGAALCVARKGQTVLREIRGFLIPPNSYSGNVLSREGFIRRSVIPGSMSI